MKELSLNILDIAENSIKAKATTVTIELFETTDMLRFSISDDGCGMKPDFLAAVTDPFTTTRTTRPVGLGIPLLKMAAEQTGGSVQITSKHFEDYPDSHGTVTTATFFKKHIDAAPLGDIVETVVTLIQCNPDREFMFIHQMENKRVELDTRELKTVLGDIPLNNIEVILWIKEYLNEQYNQ
jgi:nitrogen fixation/metabolism regulation signal transduction histidine kinase